MRFKACWRSKIMLHVISLCNISGVLLWLSDIHHVYWEANRRGVDNMPSTKTSTHRLNNVKVRFVTCVRMKKKCSNDAKHKAYQYIQLRQRFVSRRLTSILVITIRNLNEVFPCIRNWFPILWWNFINETTDSWPFKRAYDGKNMARNLIRWLCHILQWHDYREPHRDHLHVWIQQ